MMLRTTRASLDKNFLKCSLDKIRKTEKNSSVAQRQQQNAIDRDVQNSSIPKWNILEKSRLFHSSLQTIPFLGWIGSS